MCWIAPFVLKRLTFGLDSNFFQGTAFGLDRGWIAPFQHASAMSKLQTFCLLAVAWPKEATARGQPWPAREERKVMQARASWKNRTLHYGYFSCKNLLWANCQLQKFRLLPVQLASLAALQGICMGWQPWEAMAIVLRIAIGIWPGCTLELWHHLNPAR